MKHKYAVLVAVAVTTVCLAALAEKHASAGKLYLLKAGGETIAELRVKGTAKVAVEGSSAGYIEYDPSSGTMVATGGVTLKLTAGTNSISVRADEIESVPDSK